MPQNLSKLIGAEGIEKFSKRIGIVDSELPGKSKEDEQITLTEREVLKDDAKISSSKTCLSAELQEDKVTYVSSRMPATPTRGAGSHESVSGSIKSKQVTTLSDGSPNQMYPDVEDISVKLPSQEVLQRIHSSENRVYDCNESEDLWKRTSIDVLVDDVRSDQVAYIKETNYLTSCDVPTDPMRGSNTRGGGFSAAPAAGSRAAEYEGKITIYVIITCIIAASGGLMFGYDVGISGGVTSMDDFLAKFFPEVLKNKETSTTTGDSYCQYDNQNLQLFTSSLYLAALIATFFASTVTRKYGRKLTMLIAGLFFDLGVVLNAAAQDLPMLIVGRILLGCGVGFANQGVPLFLSEVAPTHLRGGLNILFQLNVTIGILFANLVNYGTLRIRPWGWRLSLGIAAVPALCLTLGSLVLVETPNSLVERGHMDQAKVILKKIRGTDNIDAEFDDLVEASRIAQGVKHPFRNLVQPRNRPQLVITCALQIFQQFTGINAIMFYAPVLFKTLGFKDDASLYSAVITGAVNVLSTLVSVYSVDRVGRRVLLLEACVQMFLSQVAIAIVLGVGLQGETSELSRGAAIVVVLMVCVFVSAFAWSWGPLGWLIPSEIFPLETRSSGQSVTVCMNMLFTFVIAQAFLSMLCTFKYGIFLFFAAWVVVMGIFALLFIPETKNIPIEEMGVLWKQHWFWKKIVKGADYMNGEESKPPVELKQVQV